MSLIATWIEDGRRRADRAADRLRALRRREVSWMERAPGWVVYALHPAVIAWLSLRHGGVTLPTAANPGMELGGLLCTSKAAMFALLGPEGRARHAAFVRVTAGPEAPAMAAQGMAAQGIGFPAVAKPDIGRNGVGVKVVRDAEELAAHLRRFPDGEGVIVQRFVDAPGEAGLMYLRRPGEGRGRVIGVTLKRFPEVVGDGRATLRDLILGDPRARVFAATYLRRNRDRLDEVPARGVRRVLTSVGNHVRGAAFEDGGVHVTPALEAAVERIAHETPGFHVGRFDVRYEDLRALRRGEFIILELNGAGAEPTQVWDPRRNVAEVYAGLLGHWRLLYQVGAEARRRGARPAGALAVARGYLAELRRLRSYPDEE